MSISKLKIDSTTKINELPLEQRAKEGVFLAAKMKAANVTQKALAKEMGYKQGFISKITTGQKPIPIEALLWLSGRFNFDPIEARPSLLQLAKHFDRPALMKGDIKSKLDQFRTVASEADQEALESLVGIFHNELMSRQDKP